MFKISKGNSKLGNIYNINLPAIVTCRDDAPCRTSCYACKGTYRFPAVVNCYTHNLESHQIDRRQAITDILAQLPKDKVGHVRIHASGDFYSMQYLMDIMHIASERPKLRFLAFTKQYEMMNTYMSHYNLPKNMRVVFSLWAGLDCYNPFDVPTSAVILNSGQVEHRIQSDAYPCSGHCEDCFICWKLIDGEQVVFEQH